MTVRLVQWLFSLCLLLSADHRIFAQTTTWNMNASGRFDRTNKAYAITDGQVVINMDREDSLCPTGLGDLADGRDSVRQIQIDYTVKQACDQWLHITWNPGGSGKEQFEVLCNGITVGKSDLVDASLTPNQDQVGLFPIHNTAGPNRIVLKYLSGDGLRFRVLALTGEKQLSPCFSADLKYPTLASFEKAIGQRGVLLDSEHVALFAPKSREAAAKVVFPYLVRAYDELYKIVGIHTKNKIAVYAFPKGNREGWGGTHPDSGSIEYDDTALNLPTSTTRPQPSVPHVSGMIEEMAHNFVHATNIQFGWEMVGWSLSIKVSQIVAPCPDLTQNVQDARKAQSKTFQQYKAANHTLPADLPPNLCDRIHAYLLWQAETRYGPNFWADFFKEVRSVQGLLAEAGGISGDAGRNTRYQITLDCFDKLPKIQFKNMLTENGVSLTTDVRSLRPEKPGWNRKLQ